LTEQALVRDFAQADLVVLRHDVEDFGAAHGLTDVALYRFVVAVNELTTNAVRHGGGAGRLELRCDGDVLRCRVIDDGPGLATDRPRTPASPRALSGRGLWLAQRNTDSLDIESHPSGTSITVTARVA
jgi:anti-sigma regulatory factor (Ser/Thr protein kinase)